MMEFPAVATRLVLEGGYREEVSFPEVGGVPVFSAVYLPTATEELGLVVCPPIMMDFLKNYRNEVSLARVLAARGVAVQRFHYRGTGHSEGDEGEVRAERLVEDAVAAAVRLQQASGVRKVAFLGTRWGGRVAAEAAHRFPEAPLVLWDPVVSPGKYVRELIMGRLVRETKDPRFVKAAASGARPGEVLQASRWEDEMSQQGRVDVLGYALHRWLYDSAKGPGLDRVLMAGGPRSVFLVQIGQWDAHRPDLQNLKRVVEGASGTCEIAMIREEPGWLFAGHRLKQAQRLIQISADWVTSQARVVSHA